MLKLVPSIIAVLLLTSWTRAAVLYDSQSFENPPFNSGATIAGQDGFTVFVNSGTSTDQVSVQNVTANTGSQALALAPFGTDGTSFRATARKSVSTAADLNEFYVSFSAIPPADSAVSSNSIVRIRNSSGTIFLNLDFKKSTHLVGTTGATFTPDTWNNVVLRVEMPNDGNSQTGVFDVWLNGSWVATDLALTNNEAAKLGRTAKAFDFEWFSKPNEASTFFVDDFLVTTDNPIPEPVSAAALLGGALLLLHRRH